MKMNTNIRNLYLVLYFFMISAIISEEEEEDEKLHRNSLFCVLFSYRLKLYGEIG